MITRGKNDYNYHRGVGSNPSKCNTLIKPFKNIPHGKYKKIIQRLFLKIFYIKIIKYFICVEVTPYRG